MAYRSEFPEDMDREERTAEGVEKPTHIMEHLATFTVTKETGIIYPADGMRRLLQLEKTNGIWSQKMQLCLDRSWVLIMDYETGTIMERFPVNSIQEPTAFTSHDPMEMYNNILVFIVADSNQTHPPEMHIFQCQSISAQDLVEDLKQVRLGKSITKSRRSNVPPPSLKSPPNIINPVRDHQRDYVGSDSEQVNDDASSTASEKYERDVTILNHCFDDIEKFIARLQHAAAAARELERRRRNRKSKKRDMGDGMLTMRTKPPPEREFIDIFQKFKLSFNLLAKLKAHIHDPNAPELVHFLFTPLALIVEAAHDTYFDAHLPHKVVSPLLTREAINLLMNCVTSKETELWHSLGNAWLIPRDQWKSHVPPYHPVFMDKWSPEYPVSDEIEEKHYRESHSEPQYSTEYNDYDQDNMFDRGYEPPLERESKREPQREIPPIRDTRSEISVDSIERTGEELSFTRSQELFLDELQAKGAHIVQVTYPRTANNDKEMTVVRGEFLEILDDSRKWWRARNSRGQVAYVPHTIVSRYQGTNDVFSNPLYTHNSSFSKNSNRADSPSDQFTMSKVTNHSAAPSISTSADWVRNERIGPSIPPPPPPPCFINTERQASLPDQRASPENDRERIREELFRKLNLQNPNKKKMGIRKTEESFINQNSSPMDLQEWLKAKCFGVEIRERLEGINGHSLFTATKADLESICGEKEGRRLFSQLNLQKSFSGFKTVRSTELQSVLARARQKVEYADKES
ncbi:epidermal growth factor receptor kinase substrate 8-like [Coccinella septempunctata]|uniref:epidermal growth factor receptor kinase substrate 8-like n=1 Tax=Coccinella septempunctata TaxID=41139 RepID=UPI001D0835FA|nr:epidermal growth factor receptor kinase substrate 8-like [Coccinella septempunctata]XP_044765455.1 epidermal growth factor receptor kinase substrate 8-like [Coccinella septempunctata]XP_044765456.1 epidermal growth factor receptor kinase substrate 8-like [Coccinella septempunctata]